MRRAVACSIGALLLLAAARGSDARSEAVDLLWVPAIKAVTQTDPARGLELATEAERRFNQQPPGLARTIDILTSQWLAEESLFRLNRIDEAGARVDASLRALPPEAEGFKIHGDLLMVRARVRSAKSRAADALADFQAAHRIFVRSHQPRGQAVALMGIGSIYQNAGDFERVLFYYRLAGETYAGDVMLSLSSANNQANALADLKRFAEAEREYEIALKFAREAKSPLLEVRILNNIASTQIDRGALGPAAVTLARGLALSSDQAATDWHSILLGTAARLELARHRPHEAVRLIASAVAGKSPADLQNQTFRDLNFTAYQAYQAAGDPGLALQYFKAYTALDDDARTVATQTNAALLAARFDFANQNARISTLKAGQLERDNALDKLQARQRSIILGGLLVLVSIVAVLLAFYLRALRRNRDSIRAANADLSRVNIELEHAMDAKSQFLATTSHEIRTPLNGVLGMTQVLLADPAMSPQTRERVSVVHRAGEAMQRLVDDILEFAKMDAGGLEVELADMDLHTLLRETIVFWEGKASCKSLTLTLDMAAAPRFIVSDARRIRQVLDNLISNAIKFTMEGGVTITATAGEQLTITIADSGIGIPAHATSLIFEQFRQLDGSTTRRFGGTGLGLAISKRIAEALAGTLTVNSTLGHGSTFRLALPLTLAASVEAAEPVDPTSRASTLAEAEVLIIGGSLIGQSVMRGLLAPHVRSFSAAAAATMALPAAATADIIILDLTTLGAASAGLFIDDVTALRAPPPRWIVVHDGTVTGPDGFTRSDVDRRLAKPLNGAMLLQALRELFLPGNECEILGDAAVLQG